MFQRIWFAIAVVTCVWAGPVSAGVQVVASIRPVHSLVSAVMEGVGKPGLIVQGGGSPHHYVMKPSGARALQNADLVFWIGRGLENFLIQPLEKLAGAAVVIDLAAAPGVELVEIRHGGHDDEHGARHMDMHFWLDPEIAAVMVKRIAEALVVADPEHSALFRRNAKTAVARLHALTENLSAKLSPVRHVPFAVYHGSFQYFEKRFHLSAFSTGISGVGNTPGAGKIAKIRDKMRRNGTKCIFSEPQFNRRIIEMISRATGADHAVLDPLGGHLEPGPELYFNLMQDNSDSLKNCLSGG
jgi:zinc transport system substrate-binding protein